MERVPEDPELEEAEDVDDTVVEDRAEVAEDIDDPLLRGGGSGSEDKDAAARAHHDRHEGGGDAEDVVPVEVEEDSEYAETELDVEEDPSADEELDSDSDDLARRKGYLSTCSKFKVVPLSSVVKSPNAKRVDVPFHGLGDRCVTALLESLKGGVVESLNFRENRMSAQGFLTAAPLVCQFRHLLEFDISNNSLDTPAVKPLCDIMRTCLTLEKIIAAGNLFGDKDAVALAEVLAADKHLLHLNFSRNQFGEHAGLAFGGALASNNTLLTLDLSWNQIRRNGGIAIANGVRSNSTLTTLNVSWNAFADIGAQAMAEALKFNSSLVVLDMANNRVGHDASIAFGKALLSNSSLKTLRLGHNPVTNDGVQAIIEAIKTNTTLEEVDLSKVPVMDSLREKINELLQPSARLVAARAEHQRATQAFKAASDVWLKTSESRSLLAKARSAASHASTPLDEAVTEAVLEGRLMSIVQRLPPNVSRIYEDYVAAKKRAALARARAGQATIAARAAVVKGLAKGVANPEQLLPAARQAAEENLAADSNENPDTIARDAVYGSAANEAAVALGRTLFASESADQAAAEKAIANVFTVGYGPAYTSARAAFSAFRAAHPKDMPGAVQLARDTYANQGGSPNYDPTQEIIEDDAMIAATNAIIKALRESGGAAAQEAGRESAARSYRNHHGKRNDLSLEDVVMAQLSEREMWDAIETALTAQEKHYEHLRDKANEATTELQDATEADIANGLRPGFRFIIDEASGGHLRRRKSVDPFLLLEEYIEKHALRLVDIFRTLDHDRSGKITREEFSNGLKTIGLGLTDQQIGYLIDIADRDGDGNIDYQEFAKLRESSKLEAARELLQQKAVLDSLKSSTEGAKAFGHLTVDMNLPGNTGGGIRIMHALSAEGSRESIRERSARENIREKSAREVTED